MKKVYVIVEESYRSGDKDQYNIGVLSSKKEASSALELLPDKIISGYGLKEGEYELKLSKDKYGDNYMSTLDIPNKNQSFTYYCDENEICVTAKKLIEENY